MARGPYFNLKSVYTLSFKPEPDPTIPPVYDEDGAEIPPAAANPFTIGAHLKELSAQEKARLGYDETTMVLEVLCADPMEGDARIRHGMRAGITPDFNGLSGTLRIQGRPKSRLTPVVEAIGVKYVAVWNG